MQELKEHGNLHDLEIRLETAAASSGCCEKKRKKENLITCITRWKNSLKKDREERYARRRVTEKKERRDTKENYHIFRYKILQKTIEEKRVAEENIERERKREWDPSSCNRPIVPRIITWTQCDKAPCTINRLTSSLIFSLLRFFFLGVLYR